MNKNIKRMVCKFFFLFVFFYINNKTDQCNGLYVICIKVILLQLKHLALPQPAIREWFSVLIGSHFVCAVFAQQVKLH